MKNYSAILLLVPFIFISCEDVVKVDLKQGAKALVVDAWVTTEDKPFTVKLSETAPYFNEENTPKVRGAEITISDNEGNKQPLQEIAPGEYATPANFPGKIGNKYILNIVAGGEHYTATTEINRIVPIDSIQFRYKESKGNNQDKKVTRGFNAYYYGPEPQGVGDYYKFRTTLNDTLSNKPQDIWNITSDEWVDGNYIADLQMNDDLLKEGDKFKVELMSITKDAFLFYTELALQVNNGGMFANAPANVRTNIFNVDPGSAKRAVGYFGGSAISAMEKKVPYYNK